MVRVGVLTSSRADFGVYLPLLKAFKSDAEIRFELIVFGTHLSHYHGKTLNDIEGNGFAVKYKIPTTLSDDSEEAISTSAALTSFKFASFWANYKNDFDVVLCMGDRYEMFSAVISGIPYGIKFAHFYGGDYSEGAIDNVYRDSLTHSSVIHFASNQKCADKIYSMTGIKENIEIIGILGLDEINNLELLSIDEFKLKWKIDLTIPSLLITFHPETIDSDKNNGYTLIVKEVLYDLQKKFQLVITMPNADTNGNLYRKVFLELKTNLQNKIFLIENFGRQSYLTCIKHSLLMIGNSSSGISEAASFGKYFVNVGNRQTGREFGLNIRCSDFNKKQILNVIKDTLALGDFKGSNIYVKEGAIDIIISKLKALVK